jgi:putative ATP-dependent endonuclease of the OLD family
LEIAKALGKSTAVITDNDGDYNSKITKKYADYEKFEFIKIFADSNESLNTLEPQIVNANNSDLSLLRSVL